MKKTQLTFAIFASFSILGCSSGSNDQPGEDARLVALRNTKIANEEKIASLEAQVKTLTADKSNLTQAQKSLETSKAALEAQKKELEAKLAAGDSTNNAEVQTLLREIAEKTKQVSALQQTIATQTAQIAELQKQVADLTEDAETKAKAQKAAEEAAQKAQAEKEAAEKAKAEEEAARKAAEQAAAEKAKEEAEKQAEEEAKRKAEAEAAAKQALVKQYTVGYFAAKTDSVTYKALADEAEKAKLVNSIKAMSNVQAGTCANNKNTLCFRETATGTVIAAYNQSYSGYAALRETYQTYDDQTTNADKGIPTNSFVYYVDTPTVDKTAVVNATYRGQVSYSRSNSPVVTTNSDMEMHVVDNQISGKVTKTSGSGKTSDVITFNSANIEVNNGQVGFDGTATFHSGSFGNENLSGSYKGQFAGSNAEQVVGTFESATTEKNASVQGAFAAQK